MNKKIYLIAGTILILSIVLVSAINWILLDNKKVQTCSESDGGLDPFNFGTIWGDDLNSNFYTHNDTCAMNNTLIEHRCKYNSNGTVYKQKWSVSCYEFNMTCYQGACI